MLHTDYSETHHSRLVSNTPIFYGWIILLVGTAGIILTSPGQTFAVSIFIEYFITDLGISRSLVSTLYTVATLTGSMALPIVGRLIDSRGPRRVLVVIAFLFGIACIYMGAVQNAVMLGLGFVLIRMFGQGSLTLVSENLINRWWVRRRGLVMGIAGMSMALLGIGGVPNLIQWLIPEYGWRLAYPILGIIILAVLVPAGIIFARDRPELYGLEPDGDVHVSPNNGNDPMQPIDLPEVNWTRAEAVRTVVFWIVALSLAVIAMVSTGLFFHMVSIFQDNGLAPGVAATVYVPIAATTGIVNLSSGALIDRMPARFLLATALTSQAVALLLARSLTGIELALIYGILMGTTSGLTRTIGSVIWASYFGRRHLGSISGIGFTVLVAGSAIGPMPFGIARDMLGSYHAVLTIAAVIPFVLALTALFVGRPVKENADAD